MKNKILKTCFVGCLATCLTLTGIFAFAPLGASAEANSNNQNTNLNNNLNNSTKPTDESTGLITPRADDPVLFTTESGLEIKEGKALSGNLAGFPYFTTNDGITNYDWVIIGIAPNLTNIFDQSDTGVFLGQWLSQSTTNSQYFNNTTLTNFDIAGASAVSEGLYRDKVQDSSATNDFSITPKNNSEIPDGCALVMSNLSLASLSDHNSNDILPNWKNSNIRNAFNEFYQNGEFGLKLIKPSIKQTTLTTVVMTGKSSTSSVTTNDYIFLLAGVASSTYCAFTYLTVSQNYYTNNRVWARGAANGGYNSSAGGYFSDCFYQNYTSPTNTVNTNVWPCRGAFVMNFLGVQ